MIGERCTDAKNDGCVAIVFAYGDDMAPAAGQWALTIISRHDDAQYLYRGYHQELV